MTKKIKIPESEWEWFGDAAHFICGRWCRFHLATKVGDYLVSTVGAYVHPRHGGGNEQKEHLWLEENWPGEDIGLDRKYETMVFLAGERCAVPRCRCRIPSATGGGLDGRGYDTAGEAASGHLELCLVYSQKETAKRRKK